MTASQWSEPAKWWVITIALIIAALVLYQVRGLLSPLIIAILLAYVLIPLVDFISDRIGGYRSLVVAFIYLLLLLLLSVSSALFIPELIRQFRLLVTDVETIAEGIGQFVADYRYVEVFNTSLDLLEFADQIQQPLQQLVSNSVAGTVAILSGFAASFLWLIFIFVVSLYIVLDAEEIRNYFDRILPSDYRSDFRQLAKEISSIWNDFLRGQIVLSLVVGVVVAISTWAIGLRNAPLLGILAGVLEVVPNAGPVISAIPAILIAFFQGSTHLTISNLWLAVLTAVIYTVIQQVENNYLLPRIIGRSVNLHPLIVILGAIGGASIGGIIGIFLAAPVLASTRVLASYAYNKIIETPPTLATLINPEARLQDMETARKTRREMGLSFVVVANGEIIFSSRRSGLADLLHCVEQSREDQCMVGSALADRVVGKTAALLAHYAGVVTVSAEVISETARLYLQAKGIVVQYEELVPVILNRNRNGTDLLDQLMMGIDDPQEAVTALRKFLVEAGEL